MKRKEEGEENESKKQKLIPCTPLPHNEVPIYVKNNKEIQSVYERHTEFLTKTTQMNGQIESIRILHLEKLSKLYSDECYFYFGWKRTPKCSFGRWLCENYTSPNIDPLLPSKDSNEQILSSNTIVREICEDFPVKVSPPLVFVSNMGALKRHITQYREGFETILKVPKKHSASVDVSELMNDLDEFCNFEKKDNSNFEEKKAKYISLREKYYPKLLQAFQPFAIQIAKNLLFESTQFAQVLINEANSLAQLDPENISSYNQIIANKFYDQVKRRDVIGLQLFYSPLLGKYQLGYEKLLVYLPLEIYNSLCDQLLSYSPSESIDVINQKIWLITKRYNAFMAEDQNGSLQSAVPDTLFQFLHGEFGVNMECFASPFNHYYPYFCSAFEDTDRPFGSLGSFFNFFPVEGSFEANPPFCEHTMDMMANHMTNLIENTSRPLSFIIFLPNWEDSKTIQQLSSSQYTRASVVAKAKSHQYSTGTQHSVDCNEKYFSAVHETKIFFFQNDAALALWPPNPTLLSDLLIAFNNQQIVERTNCD